MKQQRTTISTSLRTHQYDTKYQDHIEKADSLNFPTVLMGLGVSDRVFETKYYSFPIWRHFGRGRNGLAGDIFMYPLGISKKDINLDLPYLSTHVKIVLKKLDPRPATTHHPTS